MPNTVIKGLWALFIAYCLSACHAPDTVKPEPAGLTPDSGSMSGYFPVTIQLGGVADPNEVTAVYFGDIKTYALTPDSNGTLTVTVQGHPTPGLVNVDVVTEAKTHTLDTRFEYLKPILVSELRLYAIGASLTQGIQRGVPTQWSITHGPAALLARQLGMYFPLPLLIEGAFVEMTPDLMGPPPFCQPPILDEFQIQQATQLIPMASSQETNMFDFALTRVDSTLATHNLAVGGSRVGDTINGPADDDLAMNFLGHMVYEPTGSLGVPVSQSQLEHLEAKAPDVIVSFDLLGNDFVSGMISGDQFDLTLLTPQETLLDNIDNAVARLAATGAHVFLANLPLPTALPFFRVKRERLKQEGAEENAALFFETVDAGAKVANNRLSEQAALYNNVHVIDVASLVELWLDDGVDVGSQKLNIAPYSGLVGLDGLHFTDTAYALLVNAFIAQMSPVLDVEIPIVDTEQVWAQDRERPETLQAQGFDPTACQDFD